MRVKQLFWFVSGISAIAVILGYMVGASKSPVAGVAIPAVFGLVVMALGFIGGTTFERKLDDLKEILKDQKNAKVEHRLRLAERQIRNVPNRVGKILLIFSILYAGGLVVGTKARIDEWFAPARRQPQFPWAGSADAPPSASSAVDWIALQEQLLELGYNHAQIEQLYSIQVAEWRKIGDRNLLPLFTGPSLSDKLQKNAVDKTRDSAPLSSRSFNDLFQSQALEGNQNANENNRPQR